MSTDTQKIIYSMMGVSRYFDKKPVIKDISLSFFYGAKIGVLGLNGSGKSTLLRIMAGVDQEYNGRITMSPGFTVGYLEQEPLLGESREPVNRLTCWPNSTKSMPSLQTPLITRQ
jgi:sulfate-transporting ATPase